MKRPPPSLRARALGWLAQREHSRSELQRKLLRHVQADEADPADSADQVARLLDALQAQGLLSEARFVEGRVRQRAAGMGTKRIEFELAQHGLTLPPQALQQLRASELQRATALWQRRFGRPAADERERARQARFLAGRGFCGDTIRRVLANAGSPPDEDTGADLP